MKRILCVVPALVMAVVVPCAMAAHTHAPTPSTWELNVGESEWGGGPAMKSDRMVILTDTDKWLKWTDVTVDGDGKTMKTSWSGPQDGTMKPIVGMAGAKAGFKTADDSSHWEMPDGSTSDSTLVMTPDKKKVTITATIKRKDGKEYHQVYVYDRVK
ncbi:MAG TPA: hypothetical protein VGU25_10440 [Acidobacteriaceae bacterium]|nr:hypothetical protein [Acidobacteriaceae bacterium]